MNKTFSRYPRILAIAPSTFGLGFARMEGVNTLADCGLKNVRGNKNAACLAHAERLIDLHQPEVIVLENSSDKEIWRSGRVRELTKQLIALSKRRNVHIAVLRRKRVQQVFFAVGGGTKHKLAEILAQRYPDELARSLPPKRRPWMKEDYRMGIFAAVALALAFSWNHRRRQ
jgi:hypothetical protein